MSIPREDSRPIVPLPQILAGTATLRNGSIAADLRPRLLAVAPSLPLWDRSLVLQECSGNQLLAEVCRSWYRGALTRHRDYLGGAAADERFHECLYHGWQPLRRAIVGWRDAELGDAFKGLGDLHDAGALYLLLTGYVKALPAVQETMWRYSRLPSPLGPAIARRATGLQTLTEFEIPSYQPGEKYPDIMLVADDCARAVLGMDLDEERQDLRDDRAGIVRLAPTIKAVPEAVEDEPAWHEPPPIPRGHFVVLPRIGGGKTGISNKEIVGMLKPFEGVALPTYRVPFDRRAIVEANAEETPHARRFFEDLVAMQDTREEVAIPPFVAIGDPGGGKTTAIDAFFRGLGMHVERYACDGSSDNAAAGTPRRWTSTEVCLPLRAIMTSGHANPACLWDEVSRAGGHRQGSGGTLRDALTSFTEPQNASRYRDPCVEAEVDISHAIHACTANSTDGIAPQVLDRLRVLHFPLPGPEHMPVLARRMALEIARRQGLPDDHGELDASDLRALAEHWPGGSLRGLKKLVEVVVRAKLTSPFETRH